MKKHISSLVSGTVALLLLAMALVLPAKVLAVTNQSLAVPLFTSPKTSTFWDDVRNAGSGSVPFVVANVNNGPGVKPDPNYASAIAQNDNAKIRTLGYVQTNYQTRTFADAYNDVDNWYKFYPQTSGVYIDLLKEGAQDEVCYVAALYTHVKNSHPNDLVVLAPGGHISSAYEPYGDIFVNANNDFASYQAWNPLYKGFEDKSAYQNRFMHLIYGVTGDNYSTAFADARNNNAGYVFITDKNAPTPFSGTPSYWQNEQSDIGALPATQLPNRGKTTLPRGCISFSSSADSSIDTRTAKQSTTTSSVTVNNTSAGFDSDPNTAMKFMSLPKGVTINTMNSAAGWSCDVVSKTCNYASTVPKSSSLPIITTGLTASCDYAGGDALLRLTNYAGNRWDLRVPVKAPFGCPAGSAAAKLNNDSSGVLTSLTTQSQETTPEITPLGGDDNSTNNQSKNTSSDKGGLVKAVAIAVIVVVLLGVGAWIAWIYYKRSRYSVKL
jgi:hypothetical protein